MSLDSWGSGGDDPSANSGRSNAAQKWMGEKGIASEPSNATEYPSLLFLIKLLAAHLAPRFTTDFICWNQFECIKHPLTRLLRVPWKATKIRIQAHSTQVPYCVWDSSPHTHMATTQKKRSLLSVHANFFPVALQLDLLFESLASGCLHMPTHQRTPLHQQGIALSFHCCQSLI